MQLRIYTRGVVYFGMVLFFSGSGATAFHLFKTRHDTVWFIGCSVFVLISAILCILPLMYCICTMCNAEKKIKPPQAVHAAIISLPASESLSLGICVQDGSHAVVYS